MRGKQHAERRRGAGRQIVVPDLDPTHRIDLGQRAQPPLVEAPDRHDVLGIVNSALILRFTRASMLDVLGEDYVRTARSKGMSEMRIVLRHALKNAASPIITVVGLTFALLVSGAVVTERVFNIPGMGNLVVNAVLRRDYPVIQGTLIVVAMLYVLVNLAVDLLYLIVDKRVKY